MKDLSAERRLIRLFKEVGNNLKSWGGDTFDRYIKGPVEQGNPVKTVMGSVMAAASTLLEASDALVAGVVDNRIPFRERTGLRTTRDAGKFLENVVTLHPFRAASDAWRIATADLPLDAGDVIGGFTGSTRARVQSALATAP